MQTVVGDRWSVKLDVRDLGWASWFYLSGFVFYLRAVRFMFIPGALRGVEASFLAEAGLR